jgi:Tol biopolymer transport system component
MVVRVRERRAAWPAAYVRGANDNWFAEPAMTVLISLTAATLVFLSTALAGQQRPATPPSGFRTLATINAESVTDPHISPDARFVLLGTAKELLVHDVASNRAKKIWDARGIDNLEWSRKGDRIAWTQLGDDGRTSYVWTMPIDPKTATPTGPAQRVTAGPSAQPAISLDGRWLAFSSPDSVRPGSTLPIRDRRLSVVPVTGGPERLLAHIAGGWEYARWSADGTSIYVSGGVVGEKPAAITKVYIDGRKPEVVRAGNAEWFPGMTADRRHLVLVPAKGRIEASDRAIIVDTTGKEVGRVPLPDGTVNVYDDVLGDTALVWLVSNQRRSIEVAPINGGKPRRVPVSGESNDAPVWSPDGKRMVFQVRENARVMLAVMDADGANARIFRDTDIRRDQWAARWSPDSKYLAVVSRDWHRVTLLDVATSSFRTIFSDTGAFVGNFAWGVSSRSIAAVILNATRQPLSIDEITVTGARRKLLDAASLPGRRAFQFVGDSAVYCRSDSAAFLVPLHGGPVRKLGDVPPATELRAVTVSRDRQWLAGPLSDARSSDNRRFEVTSLKSGERRVIDVPFRFAFSEVRFSADNRSLLALGWSGDDGDDRRLYVIPLDGSAPRALANVNNPGGEFSVSPDGSSVAYSVQESRTISLILVDLQPGLRAAPPSSRP